MRLQSHNRFIVNYNKYFSISAQCLFSCPPSSTAGEWLLQDAEQGMAGSDRAPSCCQDSLGHRAVQVVTSVQRLYFHHSHQAGKRDEARG